ncbi:hypothetical protein [Thalassotalea agarivorans]|uniref:Outer membrane protein beta-barrel domain-containing protein n=1 Tax=Thalassotalea agarivorans TaxID=349064 RepID=A0A1I0BMC6_THASX|nr:hypothetical protein [Thalassotalea agarivorans]SET08014.1 hypothetical protein SAMN05660429_00995 [Thalassotalea agarivorans]
MKKRVLASLCAATMLFTHAAHANVKVGVAADMGISVTSQFNGNMNLIVGDDGMAFDYLFMNGKVADSEVDWYIGGGAWANWNNGWGVRVPLGVEWSFAKGWDVYGQVHPTVDFDFDTDFDFDGALGVRFSF